MNSTTSQSPRDPTVCVLHVTEASLGGLRRHLDDLIHGLHELGVQQVLAYSAIRADGGMQRLVKWCSAQAIETIDIQMQRRISPLDDMRAVILLRRTLRRISPTVLHLHSSKAGGVGRIAAVGMKRVRVAYTPNGLATHLSPVFGFVERSLGYLRTDFLIAVSESERLEIRELGIVPRRRLIRIDSGISTSEARQLAGETRDPRKPKVVFVGRLAEQKDPLFAAEVSARVAQQMPATRFVWVGDGELRDAFVSRIRALGVEENWTITGWVENPYPIVATSSVCALGSRYESFGYVTLEAMALGKPMVATRVAGSADLVVDGDTGILVPPGDVGAFAEALLRLLANGTTRQRMGQRALQRAELFTRDRMACQTLAMYLSSEQR
jgi:glycosyltransferase involved in cell wall biosynthesis